MSARTLRLAQYLVRTADLKSRIEGILANPQFKGVDQEFLADLATVDPSGNRGDYLTWILRNTRLKDSTQGIAWPEDRERVRRALEGFHKLKQQPRYFKKYEASPDINTYKLRTLEALNRKVHGQQQPQEVQESPATEKLAKGVSLFHQDQEYKVLRVGGPGTKIDEAVDALCKLGAGTEWCTRDAEAAHPYLERGPVYVIYRNGVKFAQTDGDQFMDLDDHPISINEHPDVWEKMVELGIFSRARFVYEYARTVVRGRWPEGEKDLLDSQKYRMDYIKDVLRPGDTWPEAAPYILRDKNLPEIYLYAQQCFDGQRWPAGEKAILSSSDPTAFHYLSEYATNVIKDRWEEAEPKIFATRDSLIVYNYIRNCLHDQRVPEAEQALLECNTSKSRFYEYHLARYAVNVIGARWPEAEPAIVGHGGSSLMDYARGLRLDARELLAEHIQKYGPRKTGSRRNKERLHSCL